MQENQAEAPFKIIHNFRTASTRSSKLSKRHAIRKMSETRIDLSRKSRRKMTENIEVPGILEEEEMRAEVRGAMSENHQVEAVDEEMGMEFQLGDDWESELEKVIPVEFNEGELDMQSPLEITTIRNIQSLQDYVLNPPPRDT